ncbi:hypothetical protein F5Y13DRAFT_175668 [Hypoxylon sp. FL1857]|nr:hypothetical protein F5Y13DRAFT_175668 [Hypoxylon sp. FL1857]
MESSFPQFGLLPAEIRCKIWRFAIPRRIVPVRLKLDLDTWNAATEADSILSHYRVTYDGQAPLLPSVGLVNHEAHYEIINNYKPLQLDRNSVRQALGLQTTESTAFSTICDSSRISSFNPDRDVLEWMAPHRWAIPSLDKLRPLLLGACLPVRHVSFQFQTLSILLFNNLKILACAVLDQDQPLETLTLTMEYPTERVHRYRLARRPSNPEVLKGDLGDVQRILLRYSACFLPWYKTTRGDEQTSVRDPHNYVHRTLANDFRSSLMLSAQEARLDAQFSIYEVLYPDDLEDKKYMEKRWSELRWALNNDIQMDIQLWLARFSLLHRMDSKPVPCHGFCLSDYGLPA